MKKILLFGGVFFFIVFLLFLFVLSAQQKKTVLPTIFHIAVPTPASNAPSSRQTPLVVASIFPPDGAREVAANQKIIITFNQPISTSSVAFVIFPHVPTAVFSRFDMLIASPEANYQQGVVYQYNVLHMDGEKIMSASFSAGTSQNPFIPLVGRYPHLDTVSNASQRQNYPDVFLAGFVPYQESGFSVDSQFSATPSGHYVFSVVLLSQKGKSNFLSWLYGLGLTNKEIGEIEIHYSGN